MTKREIERIIRVWKDRLKLQNWNIEIVWDEPVDTQADAVIKIADDYDQAKIWLSQEWRKWSTKEANENLVHELVHIFENDAGVAVESLEGRIPKTLYNLTECWYTHGVERMVERLSVVLIDLAGEVE